MAAAEAATATLPIELILEEILPKIPAKYVNRFKTVSKDFNAVISAAQFTDKHLRHSLSTDANRLLVVINQVKEGENDGVHCFDLDSPEIPPTFLPFPFIFKPNHHRCLRPHRRGFYDENFAVIVGSANGLLLLSRCRNHYVNSNFLLLNPSTGSYLVIPTQNIASNFSGYFLLGFGYDRISDDYKLVAITSELRLLVYSVKTNSWRIPYTTRDLFEGRKSVQFVYSAAVVDGRWMHWPIYRKNGQELRHYCVICCFDMHVEDWVDDVPLPVPNWFGATCMAEIGVLDGCLCAVVKHIREGEVFKTSSANVWVMKEYGVKESWVRVLEVSDNITKGLRFAPLAYRRGSSKNDVLVRKGDITNGSFCWVNMRSKRSYKGYKNKVILEKHGTFNRICEAHVCMGSLVSIPGGIQLLKTPEQ